MHKLLLLLHVLFAIFAVGPLVGAATVAGRGIRRNDHSAVAEAARTIRIYSLVSVVVAVLGMAMVQPKWHASFADTWVWLSVLLWLVAVAVSLFVLVPRLTRAAALVESGQPARQLTAVVAASGGLVALLFAVIVVLMVYRPGR